MRDADRICEQPVGAGSWGTVIMTLAAVVGVCGVFAMGYSIGRRVERLAPMPCEAPQAAGPGAGFERPAPDSLDFLHLAKDELAFYDTLMSDTGEAPSGKPARVDKPHPDKPAGGARQAPKAAAKASGSAKAGLKATQVVRASEAEAANGSFTLQVSSVRRPEEARALATAMTRQGLHPYITSATLKDRGTWYRVRVGRYESLLQANAAKAHLTRADIPARVMPVE